MIAANVLENKSKELLAFLLASAQDRSVLLAREGQFRIGMHTIRTTSTTYSVPVIVCVCLVIALYHIDMLDDRGAYHMSEVAMSSPRAA